MTDDEELFGPEGNFEDYWLGVPKLTNKVLYGTGRWYEVQAVLEDMRTHELVTWSREDDEATSLIERLPREQERGGGITGIEDAYRVVVTNALAVGKRALEEEKKFGSGRRGRLS